MPTPGNAGDSEPNIQRSQDSHERSILYYTKEALLVSECEEYIVKLIAVLFLRSVKHSQKFYIAAKVKGPDLFCDIFLKLIFEEQPMKCWLIHVDSSKNTCLSSELIPTGNQKSLIDLCHSINEVRNSDFNVNETFGDIGPCNNFEYIFYTPSTVCESGFFQNSRMCLWPYTLLNSSPAETIMCSFSNDSVCCVEKAIGDLLRYKLFLVEMMQADSRDEIIHELSALETSVENKDVLSRLQLLKEKPDKDYIKTLLEEVGHIGNILYPELLPYLKIFSEQACEAVLDSILKNEIKDLGELCSFRIEYLYVHLIDRLKEWWEEENYYLTKDCDVWSEFKNKLHSFSSVSLPHVYKVVSAGVHFFEFPTKEMKSILLQSRVLSIVASSDEMTLSCLKLHQIMEMQFPQKYIWITIDTLVNHKDEVFRIWPSNNIFVLVVECKTDCVDCDTLSIELSNLISLWREAKLIVLYKESNKRFVSVLKSVVKKGFSEAKDTFKFIDLDDLTQTNILSKEVLFQGQLVTVDSLVGAYHQLKECLTASVVSQLLEEDVFVIGPTLYNNINSFIPRTLDLLISIDMNILTMKVSTEVFAVSNTTPSELKQLFKIEYSEPISLGTSEINPDCNIFCFMPSDSHSAFQMLCEQFPLKNLHHFLLKDETLLWKESRGEVKYLKDFICTEKMSKKASHVLDIIETSKISSHIPSTLLDTAENPVIIVGESGMGKSTLLAELMAQTKADQPMNWLLYLNCTDHLHFFSQTRKEDYSYEVVLSIMYSLLERDDHYVSPIEKAILRHSLTSRHNVIVIFDGLDEIRSDIVDKVVHFIQILKDMEVRKLWIAASLHMKSNLERAFGVVVYELLPFTLENQKLYFSSKVNCEDNQSNGERIEKFILTLQKVCKPQSLFCNPLFCLITTEVFEEDLHEYFVSDSVQWPEYIDIALMYEKYINLKQDGHHKRKESPVPNNSGDVFMNRHMICALLALFDVSELTELSMQDIPENTSKFIYHVEKFGIVEDDVKGKPVFFHHSFAEYFAARWFSRNLDKCRDFLRYRLFSPTFAAMRKFFDYFLIRGYELHTSVLNGDSQTVENLVAFGVDVNATDKASRTALHLAVIYGEPVRLVPSAPDSECDMHNPIVRVLLSHAVNTKMSDSVLLWRPIQYAIELQKWDAIDLLLKEQVDFNDLDCLKEKISDREFVQTGLRVASEKGYYNLIECLTSCGINITENIIEWQDGLYNPLHIAARYGRLKLVRYLLSKKIKIAVRSSKGITPLHFAASEGMAHVVMYLLQRGADLHCIDKEGNMPLSYAIFRGDIQMVILLVEQYQCNINMQNKEGDTPLHHAVRVGHLTMVEYFLMKGAQINACNKEGNTPLHMAVWLEALPILNVLIEYKADVNFRNKYGETPLSQNAGGGNLEIVQTLVENGADVNAMSDDGNTALHWAARQDAVDVLEYIVSKGGDVNVQNRYGNSPLHRAIEHGSISASTFLVQAGCNVNMLNKAGYSARNIKSRSKDASDLFHT